MGKTSTCENGHEYELSDLDKFGMEYLCPECGAGMAEGEVKYKTT